MPWVSARLTMSYDITDAEGAMNITECLEANDTRKGQRYVPLRRCRQPATYSIWISSEY